MMFVMKVLFCALAYACCALAQTPVQLKLDSAIEQAIQEDRIPGAVLVVGHSGEILRRKAYGRRAVAPRDEPMTADTIFDCASLTKVIATTSSLMKLFEEGKLRLNDRVTEYLPEFQGGKSEITVRNLMTHFSGLRPDLDLLPAWSGYQTGIQMALREKPTSAPGARFVYSDINFILLGEIVRRVSGQTLPDFARQNIFAPLAMSDTMFQPPESLRGRIAPTEPPTPGAPPLRGVVHDPTARFMGGVAGHAGLFSTAADLARYARMLLNLGELDGVRLFKPETVRLMTSVRTPENISARRGLGWDIDSGYSQPSGKIF